MIEIEMRWHSGYIGQRRRGVTCAYRTRMSTNETRSRQNRPRRAEAIIDDACKMNKNKGRSVHQNSVVLGDNNQLRIPQISKHKETQNNTNNHQKKSQTQTHDLTRFSLNAYVLGAIQWKD